MYSDPHPYTTTDLSLRKRPHACVVTIFGASGDLTKRKLIPALYNLALEKRLPERFAVVGYARSEMSHEAFREKMREAVSQFSRTGLRILRFGISLPPRSTMSRATTIARRVMSGSKSLSSDSIMAAGCCRFGFSIWRRRRIFMGW